MRKFTLFMMFSLICFSLYGQTAHTYEPKIFIAPIEGIGRETDNDYIYKRLTYEVILQYHTVVKVKYDSDFVFRGTIDIADEMAGEAAVDQVASQTNTSNPVPDNPIPSISNDFGRREFFSTANGGILYFFDSSGTDNTAKIAVKGTGSSQSDGQEKGKKYSLRVDMIDNVTDKIISRQNFIFVTADASVDKLLSTVVLNLFNDIPTAPSVKPDDSRDRWIYVETGVLWTPKTFYEGYDDVDLYSFGVKLGLELHFLSFLSLGVGAQVTNEKVVAFAETFEDFILETPVALKGVFNLGKFCALAPYGGASWNYALMSKIEPSMFSWFAGVQFGIKDKKEIGLLVFDAKFSMDLFDSAVHGVSGENMEYKRFCFQIGVGYKFGLFQKK